MTQLNEIYKTHEIVVRNYTQQIDVDPLDNTVSVILAGPPGPQGPQGIPGASGGAALNFEQSTPSDEWIINHNFGFYPNVMLYTVGGVEMLGQVVNTTINQVRVYFVSPIAGSARLS